MNHQTKQMIDECHRLAWTAPGRGATRATISIRAGNVTYEDDSGIHQSWDTGESAGRTTTPLAHYLTEYNAPDGLGLEISVERAGQPEMAPSVTHVPTATEGAIASGETADGRYLVHLQARNQPSRTAITNPDGTTRRHHTEPYLTMREADLESPERRVAHRIISVAATPVRTDQEPATAQDVENIVYTAGELLCAHMERINREGGAAWSDYCKPMDEMPEFHERLPAASPTGSRLPHSEGHRELVLLAPQDIRIDALHPADSAIALAWEAQDPRPTRHLYETHSTNRPAMRVTSVEATETSGAITVYPGPATGEERSTLPEESLRNRLGETRADNVARITLHYVISHPDGSEETGELDCKAYADYDRDNQILLITTDCELTEQELDEALDARETARAYMNRCEESLAQMRLRQLTGAISGEEIQRGMEEALAEMSNELARSTTPFLPVSSRISGASTDGTVNISIGPALEPAGR